MNKVAARKKVSTGRSHVRPTNKKLSPHDAVKALWARRNRHLGLTGAPGCKACSAAYNGLAAAGAAADSYMAMEALHSMCSTGKSLQLRLFDPETRSAVERCDAALTKIDAERAAAREALALSMVAEVAKAYGVTVDNLGDRTDKGRAVIAARMEACGQLRKVGMVLADIARLVGVSESTADSSARAFEARRGAA
jgi:hypothetical protein